MRLLEGKVIFLAGGSKGIDLECMPKNMEEGARVVVAANDALFCCRIDPCFG